MYSVLYGLHTFIKDPYLSTSCSHTFSQRLVSRLTSASSLSTSEWGPRWVGRDFSTSRRALCTSSVSWSMTICCCDTEFWRFSKSSWTWTYIMHIRLDRKVQLCVTAYSFTASIWKQRPKFKFVEMKYYRNFKKDFLI